MPAELLQQKHALPITGLQRGFAKRCKNQEIVFFLQRIMNRIGTDPCARESLRSFGTNKRRSMSQVPFDKRLFCSNCHRRHVLNRKHKIICSTHRQPPQSEWANTKPVELLHPLHRRLSSVWKTNLLMKFPPNFPLSGHTPRVSSSISSDDLFLLPSFCFGFFCSRFPPRALPLFFSSLAFSSFSSFRR